MLELKLINTKKELPDWYIKEKTINTYSIGKWKIEEKTEKRSTNEIVKIVGGVFSFDNISVDMRIESYSDFKGNIEGFTLESNYRFGETYHLTESQENFDEYINALKEANEIIKILTEKFMKKS